MLILRHLPAIAAPVIAGQHADVEGCKQCQWLPARLIGSGAKSVGQYTACFGVVRVPEPVLPGFTANVAPLHIKLADKRHISMGNRRRSYSLWREFFKVRMTVLLPIFSVLAVSRTPAPLKAISVISSFIPGLRA